MAARGKLPSADRRGALLEKWGIWAKNAARASLSNRWKKELGRWFHTIHMPPGPAFQTLRYAWNWSFGTMPKQKSVILPKARQVWRSKQMAKRTLLWLVINLLAVYLPSLLILNQFAHGRGWLFIFSPVFVPLIFVNPNELGVYSVILAAFLSVVALLSALCALLRPPERYTIPYFLFITYLLQAIVIVHFAPG
jgi:hypothetical protein